MLVISSSSQCMHGKEGDDRASEYGRLSHYSKPILVVSTASVHRLQPELDREVSSMGSDVDHSEHLWKVERMIHADVH